LTVLSIMAVAFLVTSRLQQQTAVAREQRLAVRNHLDEALYRAMRAVEDAFCTTNFMEKVTANDTSPADDAGSGMPPARRLAPVGRWFSEEWTEKNLSTPDDIRFQAPGILVSPPIQKGDARRTPEFTSPEIRNQWTVNLLTPEVRALIPPALTNGIDLAPSLSSPFRASWQTLALPSTGLPWNDNPVRVAFAIFDVSGFLDANHFITGPTTQKLPRVCFSQADVTNWFANVSHEKITNLKSQIPDLESDPERMPFASLSYDPNPSTDPFSSDSIEAHPLLGYDAFAFSRQRKFEINTITNLIGNASSSESGDWLLATSLMGEWLRPVYSALARANPQRSGGAESDEDANRHHPDTLSTLQTVSLPWNLLNFIDGDRVPQLSPFANLPASLERIATRSNFAIEDVPLINKVTIFDIGEAPADKDPDDYYGINNYAEPGEYREGGVSNHYAVAVELWYPFSPNPMPSNMAFYAVLSTNAADTATTTNRPLTSSELRDWFNWNEAATSNTVMQTLFYAWADAYTNAVGPAVWQHPLWQVVTTNADAWFTTNMVNHPSWPVADTNGVIAITNTPIWHAFYPAPDTLPQLHLPNDDGSTDRLAFIGRDGTNALPYLIWENSDSGELTTNAVSAFTLPDGTVSDLSNPTNLAALHANWDLIDAEEVSQIDMTNSLHLAPLAYLALGGDTNLLVQIYQTSGTLETNVFSGAMLTNTITSVTLVTNGIPFELAVTNLIATGSVLPLPMPPMLGATIDVLFGILLAPELSLDTSEELYDFLMLRPSAFDRWWDFLGSYFARYPFIQQTIMPVVSRPRTDNLYNEDRIDLTGDDRPIPNFIGTDYDGKSVAEIYDKDSSYSGGDTFTPKNKEHGFGTYITVYPRKTVSFPVITEEKIDESEETVAVTNFYALGSRPDFVLYFRPVVTLDDREGISPTASETGGKKGDHGGGPRVDVDILDEALLVRETSNVSPFYAVTNIYVADPRHNAYARYWLPNPRYPTGSRPAEGRPQVEQFNKWEDFIGTTNLSTEVTEYPFIHLNRPFESIGEIGHVYTSPDRLNLSGYYKSSIKYDEDTPAHDTVSFATRSGAALLDLFTVRHSPSNNVSPWRGLVQANTHHPSVIEALFAEAEIGWTNLTANADDQTWSILSSKDISALTNRYINALSVDNPEVYGKSDPPDPFDNGSMGWKSFADMLPAIMTNPIEKVTFTLPEGVSDDFAHDWIEDAVRHLPDRVSFRQNIFVIVIAAQTLSPASTPSRPVVLADQRAAVTVIRDAFTGRWTIHDWRWLTE
jgi:hypothetical protein